MQTTGFNWLKAPWNLVFALSTGVKDLEAAFDGKFDPLVISGFKVQAVNTQAAPIASIQMRVVEK